MRCKPNMLEHIVSFNQNVFNFVNVYANSLLCKSDRIFEILEPTASSVKLLSLETKKIGIGSKHSHKISQNLNNIKANPSFDHGSFQIKFLSKYQTK